MKFRNVFFYLLACIGVCSTVFGVCIAVNIIFGDSKFYYGLFFLLGVIPGWIGFHFIDSDQLHIN